ncbi:hypothetical protein ADEAN_000023300 [Angomonas deanei]|uniref:Uncharacterized protein n=1 Tax=Angomonas deanei TaxID=59799 RepID=A0A7G2C0V8_9TRYP|nr:hypothetical protein ADEAN_000023300 [Angomonas deanei]
MLSLLSYLFWVHGVASWCMCFYVFFSCGEGVRWFLTFQNYLLIFGALFAAAAFPYTTVPSASRLTVFAGWSLYAMLVSVHHWRFKLWRQQLLPVNLPLVALFLWEVYVQLSD